MVGVEGSSMLANLPLPWNTCGLIHWKCGGGGWYFCPTISNSGIHSQIISDLMFQSFESFLSLDMNFYKCQRDKKHLNYIPRDVG